MGKWRSFVLVLLLIVIFHMVGCSIGRDQEIEIGREAAQQVEKQYPVNKDPKLNELVNEIGQNLAKYTTRQGIDYTFKILDVKEVNAFSLPGGWIYINKGLIDATKDSRDQLAGVIAHEIAHVDARHHAEQIEDQMRVNFLIATLTKGDIQTIASILADLRSLRWSRKQEYEADRLGIKYMFRSGIYNPQGLIDFFNTLLKMEGRQPSEFEQIFRTHPVTSERIIRGQKYLDDLKAGRADP
jgi:predicted Zn-dependent protease